MDNRNKTDQFTSPQNPDQQTAPKPVLPKPNNCLVWAILSTLFCCLPFGIVAIIKATQVDNFWALGQYEEAYRAAREAKTWTLVSISIIPGCILLYFLLVFVVTLLSLGTAFSLAELGV